MEPALITAIAALLAAGSAVVFARLERRDRKQQFRQERRIEYLEGLVARRFESYPEVMTTLGAVRDVQDPAGQDYQALERDRPSLLAVADELLRHLYGAPGLFMQFQTRNKLLSAWLACHKFQTGATTLNDVADKFYQARRSLREDLQIADSEERTTEFDKITGKVNGSQKPL